MHQQVPFEFDHGEDDDLFHGVNTETVGDLVKVTFPPLRLELFHSKERPAADRSVLPDTDTQPDRLEDVAAKTPTFSGIGRFGFTIGQYSEVLIENDDWQNTLPCAMMKLGGVEVTIGEVSPLAAYILNPYHDPDFFGDWWDTKSLRLFGCSPDEVERFVLAACLYFRIEFGICFLLKSLSRDFPLSIDRDPRVEEALKEGVVRPPPIIDIEPMRLYYAGMADYDDTHAFVQFYRVLEYYSVMSLQWELERLRKSDLDSPKFLVEAARMLGGKDDRAKICKLVNKLVDDTILREAREKGLIRRLERNDLGNQLYDFRNSLVHAKHDHNDALNVPSIFEEDLNPRRWRPLISRIAYKAMEAFGNRS